MILNNRNALPYRYRIFSGARYTKDNEDTNILSVVKR